MYIVLFALSIGAATFIENDFGTSAAQKLVYRAGWFSVLLGLFGASIIFNIIKFRMIQQRKWALLAFHAAIIVILAGAAVTRYFGFEGVMHIRENDRSNEFLSAETYLQFTLNDGQHRYEFDEEVLFASLGSNDFEESYLVGNQLVEVKLTDFIPNPQQSLVPAEKGKPTIKIVFGGQSGREEYFLAEGEKRRLYSTLFNFNSQPISGAINIRQQDNQLFLQSDRSLSQRVMATQQVDTLLGGDKFHPLVLRSLYSDGRDRFVFGDFHPSASVEVTSGDPKVRRESRTAVRLQLTVHGQSQSLTVYGQKGVAGRMARAQFGTTSLGVSYGAKKKQLPFSIQLHDFQMERYPGTDNAASYASEVRLIDPRSGEQKDFRIYMNHILNYDGYRFFQSSFDRDELGTYLSVNHDRWGTWISYVGYFMLTLGLVLALFARSSRFYQVRVSLRQMRQATVMIGLMLFFSTGVSAQKVIDQRHSIHEIDRSHADRFSQVVVQDHRGRMKPMHTLTREILRKVSRKEALLGMSADQVVLGMYANRREWLHVPMIKLGKHEGIHQQLSVNGAHASYSDFFDQNGAYILREDVQRAYRLEPIDRGVFEKELMKIDERVNIMNMVFSGRLFRLFPAQGDPNNTWLANGTHHGRPQGRGVNESAQKFFESYRAELRQSLVSGDYSIPNQVLSDLTSYQKKVGSAVYPSETKVQAEIALNNSKIFNRLGAFYAFLGLAFLVFLFISIFKPKASLKWPYLVLFGLFVLGFLFHTSGLAIRWYVSGRAPWSNGYESMIYIAWTTVLAGLIFTRKSFGGLAATSILSATVLLVALLSHMDPEITPLVPVLKSYWLTIHVSLEAGSYGFLMLGAVIGIINLLLFIFLNPRNKARINRIVKEMSYLSELTLMGGLIMITTGTYLGGIWANESWGRYWGWDAKETWALVTILVYAFILHMRIIPKLYGLFAYNVATIFGLASVIMTYYGVNYYLSGLHSYAAGDPVPVPNWVYMVVSAIIAISSVAFWKHRKYNLVGTGKSKSDTSTPRIRVKLNPQLNRS